MIFMTPRGHLLERLTPNTSDPLFSNGISMGLQRYREKRDFAVTSEPKGDKPSEAAFSYVIQKHDASHLHYDFRLELGGVLLSWAVPKGPSLDPKVRRLAMQTEDHPIEYGGFEGTIPRGEYGGGTVMVWDSGTWEPLEDPKQGYEKGHLRFVLHGKKLRGAWHLVRTSKPDEKKRAWLLFKSQDDEASTARSIIDEEVKSAQTSRTMEQIAGAADKVWHSNRAANRSATAITEKRTPAGPRRDKKLEKLLGRAKRTPMPRKLEPQEPTIAKRAPEGGSWAYELKYAGIRVLAGLEKGKATLQSGDGRDLTEQLPALAALIRRFPYSTVLLDGEIAVQRRDGTTDVDLLDKALREGAEREVTFFVFDALHLDGRDLRSLPLGERKSILEIVLAGSAESRIRVSRHLVGSGAAFFDAACKLGATGIVAKRLDRAYRAGKGRDWLVTECHRSEDAQPKASTPLNASARTKAPASPKMQVRLTHPDRVLYPRDGITKQELAEYYAAVSPWMIPHVANRPLTLVRCPQGVGKQTFFQKHAKPPLPESIRAIPIDDEGARVDYMAIDDPSGVLALVQMSVLEIHTWGAHADDPEKPDFLVFDLDPDAAVAWKNVITCAKLIRDGLAELGLESYVKTTGGKGLHVGVPIARRVSWDEAKEFCRAFTELVVRINPSAYVATMSKAQRRGKIFIDFFRNGRGATFIAPYSTRARDGAPVAMPLAWDELSPKLPADHFNVRNVMKRMSRLSADPWADAAVKKQQLSAAAIRAVMNPRRASGG